MKRALSLALIISALAGLMLVGRDYLRERRIENAINDLAVPGWESAVLEAAIGELVEIGHPVVRHLVTALADPDRRIRAARALGEMGEVAESALPALVDFARTPLRPDDPLSDWLDLSEKERFINSIVIALGRIATPNDNDALAVLERRMWVPGRIAPWSVREAEHSLQRIQPEIATRIRSEISHGRTESRATSIAFISPEEDASIAGHVVTFKWEIENRKLERKYCSVVVTDGGYGVPLDGGGHKIFWAGEATELRVDLKQFIDSRPARWAVAVTACTEPNAVCDNELPLCIGPTAYATPPRVYHLYKADAQR